MNMQFNGAGAEPVAAVPQPVQEAAGGALPPERGGRVADPPLGGAVAPPETGAPLGRDAARDRIAAVHEAEILFDAVARDLARIVGGLNGTPGEAPAARGREVTDVVREMRKALQTVIEERNKVEQLRRDMAGGAGDRDIDLRSARDEIGRRLALLRHARGD